MTCTDETTIEEEYENQLSYLADYTKIAFIIVDLNHDHETEVP